MCGYKQHQQKQGVGRVAHQRGGYEDQQPWPHFPRAMAQNQQGINRNHRQTGQKSVEPDRNHRGGRGHHDEQGNSYRVDRARVGTAGIQRSGTRKNRPAQLIERKGQPRRHNKATQVPDVAEPAALIERLDVVPIRIGQKRREVIVPDKRVREHRKGCHQQGYKCDPDRDKCRGPAPQLFWHGLHGFCYPAARARA